MASLLLGGPEDLSSSCPTSQEPAQTVPQMFQSSGAALQAGGSAYPSPHCGIVAGQTDPPRDPRSQSERRVSIQTPPQETTAEGGQRPGMFTG